MAALLSRVVRDQGRDDDALVLSKTAEEATAADDIDSQALWRSIRAPILARAGNTTLAEELARTALELARRTEAPACRPTPYRNSRQCCGFPGKVDEARQVIGEAIALYTSKGDVVSAARSKAVGRRTRRRLSAGRRECGAAFACAEPREIDDCRVEDLRTWRSCRS